MEHNRLVENYDEVVMNIKRYNGDLKRDSDLSGQLSQHRVWYYIPDLKLFGPAKFIGYKNMTASRYNRGHRTPEQKENGIPPLNGGSAEQALSKWFTEGDEIAGLYDELAALLACYCKKPNKKVRIFVPKT